VIQNSKEKHLFDIKMLCNIINVLNKNNKSMNFFLKNSYDPKLLNGGVHKVKDKRKIV